MRNPRVPKEVGRGFNPAGHEVPQDARRPYPQLDEGISHPRLSPGVRVIVTGANGFIGGRLVEKLVESGAIVTCLLRGPASSRLASLDVAISNIDTADECSLLPQLLETDVVFHCAYDGGNDDWNFRAIRSLISCCTRGRARLVHVSSFVVYDLPAIGEFTEEAADTAARAGYARVKLELEKELLAAVEFGGLWATIVQPTIVYGPFSWPWTIEPVEMLRYGTVILPESGSGVCNAVHVDDVVSGMILASQSTYALGQRFLISGDPVTWVEFYETLAAVSGTSPPKYIPERQIVASYGILQGLVRASKNPLAFIRRFIRRRQIRNILHAIISKLPKTLRNSFHNYLFPSISKQIGYIHILDLQFIKKQSTINSGKARELIAYSPRVAFDEGIFSMKDYLRSI